MSYENENTARTGFATRPELEKPQKQYSGKSLRTVIRLVPFSGAIRTVLKCIFSARWGKSNDPVIATSQLSEPNHFQLDLRCGLSEQRQGRPKASASICLIKSWIYLDAVIVGHIHEHIYFWCATQPLSGRRSGNQNRICQH